MRNEMLVTKMQLIAPDIHRLTVEWKLVNFEIINNFITCGLKDRLFSAWFSHPQSSCQFRIVFCESTLNNENFHIGLQLAKNTGGPQKQRVAFGVRFRRFKFWEVHVFDLFEKPVELTAGATIALGRFFNKSLARCNTQPSDGSLHVIVRMKFLNVALADLKSEILLGSIDPWLGGLLCADGPAKGKAPDFKILVLCEGKLERSFNVHKFMLQRASTTFAKAVESAAGASLEIRNYSSEVVYEFLRYLYGNSFNCDLHSESFSNELLRLSAEFDVKALVRSATAVVCLNLFLATKHPSLENNAAHSVSDSPIGVLQTWIANFDKEAGDVEKANEIIVKYRKASTEAEAKRGIVDDPGFVLPNYAKVPAEKKPLWHGSHCTIQ